MSFVWLWSYAFPPPPCRPWTLVIEMSSVQISTKILFNFHPWTLPISQAQPPRLYIVPHLGIGPLSPSEARIALERWTCCTSKRSTRTGQLQRNSSLLPLQVSLITESKELRENTHLVGLHCSANSLRRLWQSFERSFASLNIAFRLWTRFAKVEFHLRDLHSSSDDGILVYGQTGRAPRRRSIWSHFRHI